ncbi:MAG: GAF domain-containing protein [Deinococcaceae bacterium]
MFETKPYTDTKEKNHALLIEQLRALLDGETDKIANLANAAALLNQGLVDINWVGFYLAHDRELVLGPFQGLPACVRIPFGKGVCGTAAETRSIQRVSDVHAFPGHIACDAASRSEIVLPLIQNGHLVGVLDIDSPHVGRFDETDALYLSRFVEVLIEGLH